MATIGITAAGCVELHPSQYSEADRRAVDPPVQVEMATWTKAGQLDWWVKEREQWLGQVGVQTAVNGWIRAADLRRAENGQ
jgi:hypothetical protein